MVNYEEFECVFRYCDADGDGKISPKELRHCVKMVCGELSEAEVEDMVTSLDSDGDGLLGLEDFVQLVKSDGEDEKTKDLREAFDMYVMEGSEEGITPQSLKRMLSRLGESWTIEECSVMISQFDLNGDGMLKFDEFRVMMQ